MYKSNSKNMQGRASRILMRDMPEGIEISLADEREALKKRLAQIEAELISSSGERRKELGEIKNSLAARQCIIRKQLNIIKNHRENSSMERLIIGISRKRVPAHLWKSITEEAERAYDEYQKRLDEEQISLEPLEESFHVKA